jgi:lysozyme family protein
VLQRLVGLGGDGRIGEALFGAVCKADARDLIARLCDERLAFLKGLKTWPVFGVGWGRRVAEVRSAALAMAAPPPAMQPNAAIRGATAGGIATAGAAAAQQAHHAGAHPTLVVAIVAATLALVVCGWLVWRWHRQHAPHAPN